ncbi:mannose-1-phosphate guanylyltransferase [bacterium]|nr:mannose-1-phosphate guanylyltransferase [bacterium]
MKLSAVIMAGGSGKRFWPLSRESKAKQSLALFSEKTLLAETIERIMPLAEEITIVSSLKQRAEIERDAGKYEKVKVIYEPCGRNTAPCILLSLFAIKSMCCEDRALLVLPSDHYVAYPERFRKTVEKGLDFLDKNKNYIGTVGIEPAYPETGFGYIKKGEVVESEIFGVESFEEKPCFEKAEKFVKSGNYLWNGGIFIFSLNSMLEEFKRLTPETYDKISSSESFELPEEKLYSSINSISFDYAIMEKTEKPLFAVPGNFGWSDVGSWLAYFELLPKDGSGNAKVGNADFINCRNSLAVNLTEKEIVMFEKERELLVATDDAIFSASLDDHAKMREITEFLSKNNLERLL